MPTPAVPRTAAATEERLRRHAVRALDDPRQLARAARIIREALNRNRLTLADLIDEGADAA